MAKKLLADMVPGRQTKKETIKENIPTPKAKPATKDNVKLPTKSSSNYLSDLPKIAHARSSYKYDDGLCEVDVQDGKSNKESRHSLWVVAFISIIFLFFALSSIFAKAKVVVYPKVQSLTLDHNFSAFKDTNSEEVLPFSMVSLSGEESKKVTGSEEKETLQQAKGKVVIFNKFSSSSQSLNKDTRLIGSNNKIYKTESAVLIPGMVKKDLKKGTKEDMPGSVEVGIYAEKGGEEYNSGPMDFKVLGFKGTSKYDSFDVKSNGPITGGLKGKFSFISEEDKTKAESELKITLEDKLLKKITDEIPEGYILFKNATVFKTDDKEMNLFSKDKEIPLVLRGTMYGFLFEEKGLTKKIVETVVSDYDNSDVYIPNIKDLAFTTNIPVGVTSYLNIKNIDFNLSGTPKVVWKVDEEKLRNSLLSKSKSEFNQTMTQFPNITKADLVLRPIWRMSIPAKSKEIKIIVNY